MRPHALEGYRRTSMTARLVDGACLPCRAKDHVTDTSCHAQMSAVLQTVRQQQAPPTPVLMRQQRSACEPETPDMFGGPAVSGRTGTAKPAKSRGDALVAAAVGPEISTGTAGDMHGVRSAKLGCTKAQHSPAPTGPPSNAPTPPRPRSRHDRVHSKRAAHANHEARIQKAASGRAGSTGRGPPASPSATAPLSRSPSPLPHDACKTPPRCNAASAAAPQRNTPPLPQAVQLCRSDVGAPHTVLLRSTGPVTAQHNTTPEQSRGGRSNSHSRSPNGRGTASAGSTPRKSTELQRRQGHAASSTDFTKGDHARAAELVHGQTGTWAQEGAPVAAVAQSHPISREVSDVPGRIRTPLTGSSGSRACCSEALKHAVKNAATTAEHASSGAKQASRSCQVTDSQLSLQVSLFIVEFQQLHLFIDSPHQYATSVIDTAQIVSMHAAQNWSNAVHVAAELDRCSRRKHPKDCCEEVAAPFPKESPAEAAACTRCRLG